MIRHDVHFSILMHKENYFKMPTQRNLSRAHLLVFVDKVTNDVSTDKSKKHVTEH